ncbi:type III secretion system export apparatus subunit SctV [Dyella acidisoli]|uniref:EscV/YscV/HrcV family type III secretion system export apparatus protein n=1 Tax=Dyella acidisoli TaxID=1867834 RepID=A0ABQ5XPW0_9GAMM|nr:type III secretion system export apparatus subunit SctV [Dyella acidisoli]GLQ93648.1 EscV/YscV/HrcV family type III secretion system export apparatus protein [Dyella acidisoli]
MAFESILSRLGSNTGGSRSYSDLVLVAGVVAIIGLMILPLPMVAIDALVALNMLIGVGLLLVAIYIPAPVAFSSFPSVLLLTTLFRLALSIAITRSILLNADGGHIIDTFGNMVVGGNLIVGLVVFLIITVVQFIVVAKGAERVAEVAARFSLDAMPGKQLSIDSDLRSGLLEKDEARRRRRLLEVESQLHGSLDGAMKFVKGDAIAGMVIIVINLLGGLGVGVMMHGMSMDDAVHTYSVLTIGDGLVAQIPALLASISAGLIVTRTAGDEEDRNLGAIIARQISGEPRVMMIVGCIALGMMLVPGFPIVVFLPIGVILVGVASWRMRERVGFLRKVFKVPESQAELLPPDVADTDALMPPPALLLEVNMSALQALGSNQVRNLFRQVVGSLREEYGVPLPKPALRAGLNLPDHGYALYAYGVRIGSGILKSESVFLPGRAALPAQSQSDGAVATEGVTGFPGRWVARDSHHGARVLEPPQVLREHIRLALERHLSLFVGIQETSNLSNGLSRDYPDLVREMLRVVSPQRVADVLKRLVEERVPIRQLRDVFEAITDAASREKDIVLVAEYVRVSLRRHISYRYADDDHVLRVLVARPELEERLRRSVHNGPAGTQLAVEPDLAARLLVQIGDYSRGDHGGSMVMLSSTDVRRHLRKLTEAEYADIPVLSYQELVPDLRLVPVGQLAV